MSRSSHRLGTFVAIAVLLALAIGAYQLRRSMIRGFFARTAPNLTERPRVDATDARVLPAAPRTRVIVIDGLDRRTASRLPNLSRLCQGGLDLVVDTGFPTVSLPVQTVLWTGLTQEQAGIRYVTAALSPAPAQALPLAIPDAVAVAELHPYLVHSFGFSRSEPEGNKLDDDTKKIWQDQFENRATAALSSPSKLAFVHIGNVDVMGHKHGGASPEYREAASAADAMLGRLVEGADDDDVRWFLLSDHGHLAAGGHAGPEPDIRRVRGCIVGAGVETPATGTVHLIDVARSLFASTGVQPSPAAAGRPVRAVLSGTVELGTTLPPCPAATRWIAAAVLALAGLIGTLAIVGLRGSRWPLWFPVAYASIVAFHGIPTLSMPLVYPPQGRDVYIAALPGFLLLAGAIAVLWPYVRAARLLAAQLLLPALSTLAFFVLAGAHDKSLPALVPFFTANTSVLLVVTYVGSLVAALSALARAGLSWFGRGSDAAGSNRIS